MFPKIAFFLHLPLMKLVTIIGARPQIIKAAALSRAVRKFQHPVREIIVHTGQHYDPNMSDVFIRELGIPQPDYNLGVGSGSHGKQTASMLSGIEEILEKEKPDWLVVYGDTNSTLAAAIAGSKIHVPVAHIEAGLRSYNKQMPEEINRILCDHVSTMLFSPTLAGFENLKKEGFKINQAPFTFDNPGIFHCGDLMYDNSLHFASQAETLTNIAQQLQLKDSKYILATIHRNNNTDDPERLNTLLETLSDVASENNLRVILPLHPRTRKMMDQFLTSDVKKKIAGSHFVLADPASFLEMIVLEQNAEIVITDSGGVQKEAYYFKKPCIILRPETEWVELVENGCAKICDADPIKIREAFSELTKKTLEYPTVFGDGNAAEFILEKLWEHRAS
jgi:UDP-GlcNAc3NAcA epimerase